MMVVVIVIVVVVVTIVIFVVVVFVIVLMVRLEKVRPELVGVVAAAEDPYTLLDEVAEKLVAARFEGKG